ncbi:hypothetical protein RFI_11942, partial [Reticulomyxa filosa]
MQNQGVEYNSLGVKSKSCSLTGQTTRFELLSSLPVGFSLAQCVVHDEELLICGGYRTNQCYSYHLHRKRYKYICCYPKEIELIGHCVVKRVDINNSRAITLLSFGGLHKHTLVMRYKSVWNGEEEKDASACDKTKAWNKWVCLTENNNDPILIGSSRDNYSGARAVIGGSNNHLLFITHYPKDIAVFDLNTFQCINHQSLPICDDCWIWYHCFVANTKNELSAMDKHGNSNVMEMTLFCRNTGLAITYDELNNTFGFQKLYVCSTIRPFSFYAYVCINDVILLFGGCGVDGVTYSNLVHKYVLSGHRWVKCEHKLPLSLSECVGQLSDNNMSVHILGGHNGCESIAMHMRVDAKEWTKEETAIEREWIAQEEEKCEIEKMKAMEQSHILATLQK